MQEDTQHIPEKLLLFRKKMSPRLAALFYNFDILWFCLFGRRLEGCVIIPIKVDLVFTFEKVGWRFFEGTNNVVTIYMHSLRCKGK